ncbi:MAG: acyltransferase [Elusimicrobiota bacterium]
MLISLFNFVCQFANGVYNQWLLSRNGVVVGGRITVNGRLYIHNRGKLMIGKGVKINSGARYSPIGGQTQTRLIVLPGATLCIGNHVGISNSTIVAQTSVEIGDGAMIGGSCNIWDTDFHSLDSDVRGTPDDHAKTSPVHVGERAFIGAHSIILKGVSIGKASIVGAGSIVRRSVGMASHEDAK